MVNDDRVIPALEKESTLALFKQLESDVKTCLEKDLDTNEELKKQKDFTNNFTAMLDFLVKLKAPNAIQAEIKDILKLIREWDVYAYWFKEMKDLVARIKAFMADFTSFAEGSGLIPKAQKPVEKPPAAIPEQPGLAGPVKPTVPSLLKPIVLGASPQKPTPPGLPPVAIPAKPAAVTDGSRAPPETRDRSVPLLKPVFKIPPVKLPGPASPGLPLVVPQKPAERPAIDATSTPVPLKALVDEKKLEIHVKPVKLIKPILAVQPAPVTPPVATGEPLKKVEVPERPSVPVIGSKPAIPAPAAQSLPPQQRPAAGEKPLLVPKPIKIVVPDLGSINLDNEIPAVKPGVETPKADSAGAGDELFTEMGVIEGSIPVKGPPARAVKPIPVKVQLARPVVKDPNDEIVEDVVQKVTKRLDARKVPVGNQPVTLKKAVTSGDEYITPMEVAPDDIDEWTSDGSKEPVSSPPAARQDAAKQSKAVEMLDAAESWDDEQISSILDEALDEGRPALPKASPRGPDAPGPVSFKMQPVAHGTEKAETSAPNVIGVIDQEPKKTRLQDIKKAEPPAATEPVDSMSLFMSGLGSKRADHKPSTSAPGLSLFRPAGLPESQSTTTPVTMASGATRQQQAAPIGSDVDVEALPDTKDGLYQALIALEGKRYAIERARKDLRADLDKGIIKPPAYEQKLADLKGEMDKIADKIKEIREKIKKFK